MTLTERVERFCDRVAAEIKTLKIRPVSGAALQAGKVVFDLNMLRHRRNDNDWMGLVNNQVANSSSYILRFPQPFAAPPTVVLTQERPSPAWRFVEIRKVTAEYAVINCNYWGADLTLHWMATDSGQA